MGVKHPVPKHKTNTESSETLQRVRMILRLLIGR
jgi:hypothetical protein